MKAKKELTHPLRRATLVLILDTREVAMIRSGTINTIHELSAQGKSIREIARIVGIARNTVRRASREANPLQPLAQNEAQSWIPTKGRSAAGSPKITCPIVK